ARGDRQPSLRHPEHGEVAGAQRLQEARSLDPRGRRRAGARARSPLSPRSRGCAHRTCGTAPGSVGARPLASAGGRHPSALEAPALGGGTLDRAVDPRSTDEHWAPDRLVLARRTLAYAGLLHVVRDEHGEILTHAPLEAMAAVDQRYPSWA